jgi:hypothetical protein
MTGQEDSLEIAGNESASGWVFQEACILDAHNCLPISCANMLSLSLAKSETRISKSEMSRVECQRDPSSLDRIIRHSFCFLMIRICFGFGISCFGSLWNGCETLLPPEQFLRRGRHVVRLEAELSLELFQRR